MKKILTTFAFLVALCQAALGQQFVKNASTGSPLLFFMTDSADHISGKTGLSPTVTISKAGAAFGSPSGAVTEIANGWYKVAGNATDTNTNGNLALHATGTGADPFDGVTAVIIAADLTDTVRLGLTALPNAAAAASGGLIINGSNTGTVTLAALTVSGATTLTGNVAMAAGLNVTQSTANTAALVVTGNGTGNGATFTSGSGATGNGLQATAASTNGNGLGATGTGTGAGQLATAGLTGNGVKYVGGGTSGDALLTSATSGHGATFAGTGTTKHGINATGGATTSAGISAAGGGAGAGFLITGGLTGIGLSVVGGGTSGDGIKVVTTSGNGMNLAPVGTSMHGLLVTGGNGGTSDGIKATAGTGGVDIRGNITGNLVGTVSTLTTYTGNTVQTGDSFARIGALGAGLTAVPPLVWDVVLASHLTAGTTGFGLNAASSAGDPWATALPGAYSAGTGGFILGTNLNALITSRLAPTTAGRTLDVAATGEAGIDFSNVNGTLAAANIAADAITSTQLAASAATKIANAAWDTVLASHLTAGTTGAALNAAGSAGDPWITPLPGAYAAGQAGFIVGTNLNATMTSRLASDVTLVRRATAQAGAASTITLDSGASAVDGFYSRYGMGILIASGTGIGQYRVIVGYVGSTKVATLNVPWLTNPDNTSVFVIIPR